MQRIVLHVDLDSFYASLEELRNKQIQGKPIVVCVFSGRTEDSGAVSTANYRARELGIKAGMPIVFAKRLAKDKDVVFLPVDMDYYHAVSERIMEILEEETDIIQQVSIDEAYLDITGRSSGDWDNAQRIAEEIKRRIRAEEGLTCSIGIGPNRLLAKMASERKKPDGLTIVKESQVNDFLRELPVSDLHGVGDKTVEVLNELGIKTADGLATFDLLILVGKFGKNRAKMLQEKAQGIDDTPVEPREIQQISRIATLKEDTSDLETILEKLLELSTDMKDRIEKKQVVFRTVSIITIDTDLKLHTRGKTIKPTDDVSLLLETSRSLLEGFLEDNPGKKMRRVGMRVSNLACRADSRNLEGLDRYLDQTLTRPDRSER
ncbi:DNA polymerase IV [Candidatus Bathyarchaeota archaeon]|nr:DNA polymerase IV [Candidatus Bathyarchaeota archaeon]